MGSICGLSAYNCRKQPHAISSLYDVEQCAEKYSIVCRFPELPQVHMGNFAGHPGEPDEIPVLMVIRFAEAGIMDAHLILSGSEDARVVSVTLAKPALPLLEIWPMKPLDFG